MSKRFQKISGIAIGSAIIATAAATLALANIPTGHDASAFAHDDGPISAPITGPALFAAASSCVTGATVVAELTEGRDQIGGETMVLARGLDQAFADAWRVQAGLAPIAVSGVVAHAFANAADNGVTIDVVEFDVDGCAVSRTLLTGDDWDAIMAETAVPAV